ncbi:hypothetical protein EDD17DRAFT_1109763 [Pisolithus thermaeus]|nr:hypothetical protein EV401DRAFT_283753 [Pisolithus croceorrhizus]KAI6167126.1 hypothetical protein EDD17DRAFT_1109763 [Pisolithus thermaeus]
MNYRMDMPYRPVWRRTHPGPSSLWGVARHLSSLLLIVVVTGAIDLLSMLPTPSYFLNHTDHQAVRRAYFALGVLGREGIVRSGLTNLAIRYIRRRTENKRQG